MPINYLNEHLTLSDKVTVKEARHGRQPEMARPLQTVQRTAAGSYITLPWEVMARKNHQPFLRSLRLGSSPDPVVEQFSKLVERTFCCCL